MREYQGILGDINKEEELIHKEIELRKISRDFRKLSTSKVHHQKGILMDSRIG